MVKIISVGLGLALTAGLVWGEAALMATAVLGLLAVVAWAYGRTAYICVPELSVGIVYNTRTRSFSRFLAAGHYWLLPFVEELTTTIDLTADSAHATAHEVITSSGIPVTITWSLSYNLNPFRIPAHKQAKLARSLPRKSAAMVAKHTDNALRHLVGSLTVDELWQPGAQRRLERELRQAVGERLADAGFEVVRVMIGAVEMPAPVQAALQSAQKRRLQTENEAQSLARLQQVVNQFSDSDMARLLELERIQALGQHGVALVYPAMASPSPAPVGQAHAAHLWPPHRVPQPVVVDNFG